LYHIDINKAIIKLQIIKILLNFILLSTDSGKYLMAKML
jgi:hypothetical protein